MKYGNPLKAFPKYKKKAANKFGNLEKLLEIKIKESIYNSVSNIVAKGEFAFNEQYLLLPCNFHKPSVENLSKF